MRTRAMWWPFLLIAACAGSVVTAWGLALSIDADDVRKWTLRPDLAPTAAEIRWWERWRGDGTREGLILSTQRERSGARVTLLGASDPGVYGTRFQTGGTLTMERVGGGDASWIRVLRVETGWPLRCLAGERWEYDVAKQDFWPHVLISMPTVDATRENVEYRSALRTELTGDRGNRELILPLRPIWTGLLVNTAIWFAVSILGVASIRGGVHLLRRRAGRCPGCGYRLTGGNTVCPECGAAVASAPACS